MALNGTKSTVTSEAQTVLPPAYDNPVFSLPIHTATEGGNTNSAVAITDKLPAQVDNFPSAKSEGVAINYTSSRGLSRNAHSRVLGRRERNGFRGPLSGGLSTREQVVPISFIKLPNDTCPKVGNLKHCQSNQPKVTKSNMTTPLESKEQSAGLLPNGNTPKTQDIPERETWGKKLDFLLSVIGFAVDLGNVWRFPYVCYRNGGGAFLLPYLIMLLFAGLPLFYMELALGQYQRCGMISVWRNICPMFTGLGYGICFISIFVAMYYNTVIAWAVIYTVSSFQSEVPWARCGQEWNTPRCLSVFDHLNQSAPNNTNMSTSSAEEFFNRRVLEIQYSDGIENVGNVKWSIALALLGVFIVIYFALWKGIKSSGKAVWVTATLPYIVLIILLVRGCTLPGAMDGILYYVRPQWHRLLHIDVWIDAAAQIFFSLGPGFGTLLALSSYNKFHNNCYMDALITASINCFTSFMAGFVVFSVLGYMSFIQNKTVENVAIDGPGLVFVVYPEALATLDGSVFWSILFFLMLITLGLDSSFGGLEAVITGVCDEFPKIKKYREVFVGVLLSICFLGGLATTTHGGQYVINLLDRHGAPISILFICFCEAVAVNWFYGVRRFSADLKRMLGFEPGIFWKICWAGICPVFLLILFILSCYAYSGLYLGPYLYPYWATVVGWLVTASSLICIPLYIIFKFIITPGSFKQRLLTILKAQPQAQWQRSMSIEFRKPSDIKDKSDTKQSEV